MGWAIPKDEEEKILARASSVRGVNLPGVAPAPALPSAPEATPAAVRASDVPAESESGFQKTVIGYAQLNRWRVAHFKRALVPGKDGEQHWVTNVAADGAGFPDLILIRDGVLIFAELKSDTGRTTQEQKRWLADLGRVEDRVAPAVMRFVWRPKDWETIERVLGGKE